MELVGEIYSWPSMHSNSHLPVAHDQLRGYLSNSPNHYTTPLYRFFCQQSLH